MNITVEPPISAWRLSPRAGAERHELATAVNRHAATLGAGVLHQTQTLIATGHQAWLWHPGILAKYSAMAAAAGPLDAGMFHLVVDQDTHEAMKLDLPVRRGDRLEVETLQLAPHHAGIPSGWQPPVDATVVVKKIEEACRRLGSSLRADPAPIAAAFKGLPPCRTLAEQIALVLQRLMSPYTGVLPVCFVGDLTQTSAFHGVTERMLYDATKCVAAYNRAAAAVPAAGITPLAVSRERVELPLWLLGWGRPRQRVFADISDTRPILTTDSGRAIDPRREPLAPRALLMTAALRRWFCDLFIHGKGGGVYDRITEAWWRQWTGEELGPMAVVSADLRLDFDAPRAEAGELTRAVWWAHHVESNLDRLPMYRDLPQAKQKRELLARMENDRDRVRRAAAFAEVHRINDGLRRAFPGVVTEADDSLRRARAGVANRAVAARRDWCFALYPHDRLAALRGVFAPDVGAWKSTH